MYSFRFRAGCAAMAIALTSLTACADEQDPLRPDSTRGEPQLQLAPGDVYTVTNTQDNGTGSLRWALSYVTGGETVRFDPAIAGRTITLDSAITFTKPFTLEGPAGKGMVISGGGNVRLFMLHHTQQVTLRNLTLTGGQAPGGSSGGVTHGLGDIVLENVSVHGNQADGISAILAGAITMINSTVSGNVSHYGPSGPSSPVKYPAVLSNGPMTLINSTIAFNTDGGVGGGSLTMRNSIVSNNGNGLNCGGFGQTVFTGTNIADDDSCGGITGAVIADPMLAPLADNGGPNLTHALKVGSPAINAGTNCSVAVDQRYVARDAQCDVGSFEFIDFTNVTLTVDAGVMVNRANGWVVVTGTVRCTRDEVFDVAVALSQSQKKGKNTSTTQASGSVPVACGITARPWSVALAPAVGVFEIGAAQATAQTANQAKWVTPVSVPAAVRLLP